jgi:hypothetical protein
MRTMRGRSRCLKPWASAMSTSSTSAPAISTPVGATADHHEAEGPLGDLGPIGVDLFEALEDVVAQPQGVGEPLQRQRVLLGPIDPEVAGRRPGGEHEVVEA